MGWIPFVAAAVGEGINYLKHRNDDNNAKKQAAAKQQYAQQQYQNDPKVLLRNALANQLFSKHPEWDQQYPGLKDKLLSYNPYAVAPPTAPGTASLPGAFGNFVLDASKIYASQHKKGTDDGEDTSSSGFDVSRDAGAAPSGGGNCPAGQVYIEQYGCV